MRPGASLSEPPPRPARLATASARIERAVSAGETAPMSSPAGPRIRSMSPSVSPASRKGRGAVPGSGATRAPRRRTRPSATRGAGISKRSSCVRTTTAVSWSGRTCASASSGQATSSSSAFGTRSFVAKQARASATTVRQPTTWLQRRRVGEVERADHEEAQRRSEHLDEDVLALELDDGVAAARMSSSTSSPPHARTSVLRPRAASRPRHAAQSRRRPSTA